MRIHAFFQLCFASVLKRERKDETEDAILIVQLGELSLAPSQPQMKRQRSDCCEWDGPLLTRTTSAEVPTVGFTLTPEILIDKLPDEVMGARLEADESIDYNTSKVTDRFTPPSPRPIIRKRNLTLRDLMRMKGVIQDEIL